MMRGVQLNKYIPSILVAPTPGHPGVRNPGRAPLEPLLGEAGFGPDEQLGLRVLPSRIFAQQSVVNGDVFPILAVTRGAIAQPLIDVALQQGNARAWPELLLVQANQAVGN